jgi:uncharacterized protein YukE
MYAVDASHLGIVEDIERIAAGVRGGAWLDGSVVVARDGLSGLAAGPDPVGVLRPAWLLDHVRPLTDPLDWLAGDPAQVSAHAQAWRRVAHTLSVEADRLTRASRSELPEWSGPAADAYARWVADRVLALGALSRAAATVAAMSEDAGALIGTVRRLIRGAVVAVVSQLLAYAPDPTTAADRCAECASRITRWLRDLIANLRRMEALAGRLTSRMTELAESLRGRAADHEFTGEMRRPDQETSQEYDRIREADDVVLVTAAAGSYGFDEADIRTVKDHVFRGAPHPDLYFNRPPLAAPSKIAEAWSALRSGAPTPEDIIWLHHERAETRRPTAAPPQRP